MSNWTSGYVAEIGYTYGYYRELNPHRVTLAFLKAGVVAPKICSACELGYGQGLSINLHAAASNCSWYGTDFNPAQAGFAEEMNIQSEANAKLFDDSFYEFSKRDLPDFDYIGVHGIWSWISDENREKIVEFIKTKLKVGGVLYISYNTLPGWAPFIPMRHLLTEHVEVFGAKGEGIINRIDEAIKLIEKLIEVKPQYITSNPDLIERLKKMKVQDKNYLAHEYFNRDWNPMHFSSMVDWLKDTKLEFVCSANLLDYIDAINLTKDQKDFLNKINNSIFRETTRDFIINQQFRKEYWIKGKRTITPLEQDKKIRELKFILITHPEDVVLSIKGAIGEAKLSEEIYYPVLKLMSDYSCRTIGEIEDAVRIKNINLKQLIELTLIFYTNYTFGLVQDEANQDKIAVKTEKLNNFILKKSRYSNEIGYLASPVTGEGYFLNRFQQLFLYAYKKGENDPLRMAEYVLKILKEQGQFIIKDNKNIKNEEDQLKELHNEAIIFNTKILTILKAIRIA
jgi:SAM-dependent methyltransferase